MKRATPIALLFLAAIFAGCSATKFIGTWTREGIEPKKYTKVGVVIINPTISNRFIGETVLAKELQANGVPATPTVDIFPRIPSKEELEKYSEEELKKLIVDRVVENDIDALLVVSMYDQTEEQQYVQSAGPSMYYGGRYGYPYYGYYGYAYSTVYQPGYYETTRSYFMETTLHDVATEQLVWVGQTQTTDPANLDYERENFAKLMVKKILESGVIYQAPE